MVFNVISVRFSLLVTRDSVEQLHRCQNFAGSPFTLQRGTKVVRIKHIVQPPPRPPPNTHRHPRVSIWPGVVTLGSCTWRWNSASWKNWPCASSLVPPTQPWPLSWTIPTDSSNASGWKVMHYSTPSLCVLQNQQAIRCGPRLTG